MIRRHDVRAGALVLCCGSLLVSSAHAGYRKQFVTVDAQKTKAVKRLAVAPFFFASSVSVDDPSYTGAYSEAFPTVNVIAAAKTVHRFQIVDTSDVVKALKNNGFEGFHTAPGEQVSMTQAVFNPEKYRVGMSIQQALAAGRDVKADAVLTGVFGLLFGPISGGGDIKIILTMRLLDPGTGKVIWGGTLSEKGDISLFHPIDSQAKQMQSMAARMLAEVP